MTDNPWLSQPAATPYEGPVQPCPSCNGHSGHWFWCSRAELEARLAEAERRGAERGWDEGWRDAQRRPGFHVPPGNPYREEGKR